MFYKSKIERNLSIVQFVGDCITKKVMTKPSAVAEAARFGIHHSRAVTFENDELGQELNYQTMGKIVSCARSASSPEAMQASFDADMLAPIREDYKKRHKKFSLKKNK